MIYHSLSELEKCYWRKLAVLFALVQAQKPEKGIAVLIMRARQAAQQKGTLLADELEEQFRAASQRTYRRIDLLNACSLQDPC